MMNDIKFRAFWKGKMRRVLVIDWLNDLVDLEGGYIDIPFTEVELVQSTGLKDINGIEIYAEDIVREIPEKGYEHLVMNGNLGVVKLNSGSCTIINAKDGRTHFFFYTKQEVLGNIHEHPELLGDNQCPHYSKLQCSHSQLL